MSKNKSQKTLTIQPIVPTVVFNRAFNTAVLIASLALVMSFSQIVQAQTVSQKFAQTATPPAVVSAEITISDLANAQRLKLKDDILKAQGLPTQQERVATAAAQTQSTVAAKTIKSLPTQAYEAPISVHSIYTIRKGAFIVELTDGRNLLVAKTGARFGNRVITEVNDTGILVNRTDCKGKCNPDRLVTVGGNF